MVGADWPSYSRRWKHQDASSGQRACAHRHKMVAQRAYGETKWHISIHPGILARHMKLCIHSPPCCIPFAKPT
jgi:hypothetical protein